mgnify:FL=1
MKLIIFPAILLSIVFLFCGCSDEKRAITSLADIQTASVGAMTGTTGELLLKTRFPKADVKSFDDIMDAVAALKSNQLDAVITAFPAANNVVKHNKDLMLLSEPVDYENTAAAVRKESTALLEQVNRAIDEMHRNGTLADMRRRWLKTDLSPYEEPQIDLPTSGEVLKIGTSATREPFCFVDANKRVTGHDGELSRRIGAMLNRPIEFMDMKFSALIPALQSGKVDLIIAGMSETEERKKSVNFSKTYFKNSQVLIIRRPPGEADSATKSGLQLKTISDIKDKRIAVLLGSVHDKYVMKEFPDAKVLQYRSPPEMVLAVRSGKADVALYTTETLAELLRTDKDLGVLGDTLFTIPIGMGFNKANPALREQFNEFLARIKQDGTFDDLVKRWVRDGNHAMPRIPNPKTNGVLVVGYVSDKGLPFTVMENGKPIGIDVELAERFAAYLGKALKLQDMEFGALIMAVSSNKIDMISSTLMITEDRKKQIDFSDPYMRLGASVFTLQSNLYGNQPNLESDGWSLSGLWSNISESFYNNIIVENRYLLILDGLQVTIIIAVLSTIFGTLLGGLICFMRMSRSRLLIIPAKVYISLLRGTPVLVILMIIFYVVFASVDIAPEFVAVIAFGLNFAAYVSEMYRSGIEGIDAGQTEAGIAMGFTKVQTFLYIVLPQAVKRILPVYRGEVISMVKMTSIVGYIAVQDLTKASDIIRSRTFDAFFPLIMVAVLYYLIAWLLMVLLGYLEKVTDTKYKARKGGIQ